MEYQFDLMCLQATYLIPCYIGGLWIGTDDSLLCHQWNACCPSLLFLMGGSAVDRGYHPAARRCFTGAANSLNDNFASLLLISIL
ncbi:hypothetical protein HAX54_045001, partial [Datura stramonium]|nr:hypothetical protein [Datura stramonium]